MERVAGLISINHFVGLSKECDGRNVLVYVTREAGERAQPLAFNQSGGDGRNVLVCCQYARPRAIASNIVIRGCSDCQSWRFGGSFQRSSGKIRVSADAISYLVSHWRLRKVLANSWCPTRHIGIERAYDSLEIASARDRELALVFALSQRSLFTTIAEGEDTFSNAASRLPATADSPLSSGG